MIRREGMKVVLAIIWALCVPPGVVAQVVESADSIANEYELKDVVVRVSSRTRSQSRVESVDIIGKSQLIRAACCNLGESFTTNPSVDVSYSDAATGARQIKLLGLSGTYVQMLTENVPNLRGASLPYALGYVPGPWMQSIQVSKGASSVKNGYESTTGQINIEFLKPQATDGVRANAYLDSEWKQEVNVDGSIHLNDRLSTATLLHFENRQTEHDGNGDGFMDMPKIRQYNLMHRWAYVSPLWISQLSMRVLRDERIGGQGAKHLADAGGTPYTTSVKTNRYEVQWKNGWTLDADHNTSLALMLQGSWHDGWNTFGLTQYDVTQKNGYAQLMFETDLTDEHNLSVGASLNHDYFDERSSLEFPLPGGNKETTSGVYAQYTYKLGERLTVMPGIRWDYSTLHGGFLTPRLHIKYSPLDKLTLRASAGKGYRTPHALAENITLLASGRRAVCASDLKQEEAWNMGLSAGFNIPIRNRNLELNAEYYYTDFKNQLVIDYTNTSPRDGQDGLFLTFGNLSGKSYSHTLQVDATYPFFEGFTATGAFRLNDVKCTYGGELRQKPLTSRYKGLLTLSYKTPTELWQFDLTGQLNGGGVLYNRAKYPAYFQLQLQVTREFRHVSIYLGGENLTNYRIQDPIMHAHQPWSQSFDATQVWGPIAGAMAYIGVRLRFEKI